MDALSRMEPLLQHQAAADPERLPTFTPALVNMFKAVFGTGLLAMPYACVQVGLTSALILTGVVGVWCVYTMVLIAESVRLANASGYNTKAERVTTFGELVTVALGPTLGAVLGTANLMMHQLLVCAAYLVFVGDNVAQVFGVEAVSVIIVVTPPYALLCCLRDMRLLGPTSAAGTAILFVVLVAVLWDGYSSGYARGPPLPRHTAPSVSSLASFLGVGLFTFAGHTEVVPVVCSMGADAPRFRVIAAALLFFGVPAIGLFSVAAAAAFGLGTPQNIMLALHSEQGSLLKLLISLAAFFSLPVKMFPAVATVERLVLQPDGPAWLRTLVCVGLAASSAMLAITLPDFGFMVACIGAFCNGLMSFVLPPAMILALGGAEASSASRAAHALLFVLGALVTVAATVKVVAEKLAAEPAAMAGARAAGRALVEPWGGQSDAEIIF